MQAADILKQCGYSCVVEQNGVIVDARCGMGVRPLLALLSQHPESLNGASVADRVIGKAAAMLLVCAGAASVYGAVMSRAADEYLAARQLPHSFGALVPAIRNRAGDGLCPIEQSVLSLDDPAEGLAAIRATAARLMAAKARQ